MRHGETLHRNPERAGPRAILVSVQALRAFAALAVVAYHALQWGPGGFDVGRAGVDVFFVISGLVIWRSAGGTAAGPWLFLWRRLIRIAPLYWLATLAVAATAVAWPNFLPEVRPGWRHLALSLAFIPHLDPRGLPFPTLPPGWTLNYEAVFYLAFAAALLAPRRWRAPLVMASMAGCAGFGLLVSRPSYFLGANAMLLEFAAGVALGWILERDGLPRAAWGGAMVAAALAWWTLLHGLGLFNELWRPLFWGLPAFVLVAGAVTWETRAGPRWTDTGFARRCRAAGDASYALYIVHLPATALIAQAMSPDKHPWLFLTAALGFSAAAAAAARAWIEKPLQARLRAISLPAAWKTGSIRYSRPS